MYVVFVDDHILGLLEMRDWDIHKLSDPLFLLDILSM